METLKLIFLIVSLTGFGVLFWIIPGLSTPAFFAATVSTLLSPIIRLLERKGYSRFFSVSIVFFCFSLILMALGATIIQFVMGQWDSFKEQAPSQFKESAEHLQIFEAKIKLKHSFLNSIHFTESLLAYSKKMANWVLEESPSLVGQVLFSLIVVPLLSFIILNEGRKLQRLIFQLVPNRFFESFFLVTTQIIDSVSNYVQAKLIEAGLIGALVTIGLFYFGVPYSMVLGIFAGAASIIPYVGPFIGAAPAFLLIGFDATQEKLLIQIAAVFVVVQVLDMILIFPIFVAKLVKLHPILLLVGASLGQHYYGLVGILISVPIISTIKIVLREIYLLIYQQKISLGVEEQNSGPF